MKKYIAIALLMVLGTVYPAYARWSVGTAGGGAAGTGLIGNQNANDGTNVNLGDSSFTYAFKFTTTTAGPVDNVHAWTGSWTTDSATLYCALYSHDSTNNRPLNQLTYGSATVTTPTNGGTDVVPITEYSIGSATVYWIVCRANTWTWGASATEGGENMRVFDSSQNGLAANGNTEWEAIPGALATDLPCIYAD